MIARFSVVSCYIKVLKIVTNFLLLTVVINNRNYFHLVS